MSRADKIRRVQQSGSPPWTIPPTQCEDEGQSTVTLVSWRKNDTVQVAPNGKFWPNFTLLSGGHLRLQLVKTRQVHESGLSATASQNFHKADFASHPLFDRPAISLATWARRGWGFFTNKERHGIVEFFVIGYFAMRSSEYFWLIIRLI